MRKRRWSVRLQANRVEFFAFSRGSPVRNPVPSHLRLNRWLFCFYPIRQGLYPCPPKGVSVIAEKGGGATPAPTGVSIASYRTTVVLFGRDDFLSEQCLHLQLGNGLGGIQGLGTYLLAVEDGVAAEDPEV